MDDPKGISPMYGVNQRSGRFRGAAGRPGAFHGNLPLWPSADQRRAKSRAEAVARNSPVPLRTSTTRHPAAAGGTAHALSKPRPVAPPEEGLASRFRELAERWREDTQFQSSATALFMHPDYQEIIGMGHQALPLILQDLAATRSNWFWALRAITGENPVPPEERGQIGKMTERWLAWGHAHEYL